MACSKVGAESMFAACNNKIETSHFRDYCLTDTCAYAAAPVTLRSLLNMHLYNNVISRAPSSVPQRALFLFLFFPRTEVIGVDNCGLLPHSMA